MKKVILLGLFGIGFFYSKAQVNEQTGSAQLNVPIFSFSDSKSGLSHQISLNYSSGNGLKVNDNPSNIGQGWELNCGGAIYRRQNGEPDDQNSTTAFPPLYYGNYYGYNQTVALWDDVSGTCNCDPQNYIINYYPNGFLYSEFPLDLTEDFPLRTAAPREMGFLPRFRKPMDKRWRQSRRVLTDRQQDVFIFNINGNTGEFLIGKNGDIIPIINSKLKIEKFESDMTGNNIRTRINSFKITDESGIVYTFNDLGLSEVLKPKEISSVIDGYFSFSVSGDDGTGKYTVDQWSLTEINNPFTNEKILFNYQQDDVDYISQKIPTYSIMEHDFFQNVNIHELRAKGKAKKISSVVFPDGHNVVFNYNGLRQDIDNDVRLSDVTIKYNNSEIHKLVLNHSYFYKKEIKPFTDIFPETERRFLRLSLSSVQKQSPDGTSEPAYQFSYNIGAESTDPKDIVPPRFCFATDHWGYYNKADIVDINLAVPSKETFMYLMRYSTQHRWANVNTASYGLLKSVKNPSGGEQTFIYKNNFIGSVLGGNDFKYVGGVYVSDVIQYDGINHSNDIVTKYEYLNTNNYSSYWGYEAPTYNTYKEVFILKNPNGYKYGGAQISNTTGALAQSFIKTAANSIINHAIAGTASKIGTAAGASSLSASVPGLGSATQALSTTSPSTTVVAASGVSTTVIATLFPIAYSFVIGKMIEGIFYFLDPVDYDHNYFYQFYPMNYNNPIGGHYSRLIISKAQYYGNYVNGKVIKEFSKPTNISSEILPNLFPYSNKQRFANWKYDLLEKETIINNNNQILAEKTYDYNKITDLTTLNNLNFKSCKVDAGYLRSANCESATHGVPVSDLAADFYTPIIGRTELSSTTEKMFSKNGIISEQTSSVQYNENYLPKQSILENSKGDKIVNKTYYVSDYNDAVSPAIALLKSKKAIATPVSTETWLIKKNTLQEFLIDASINEFGVLPNGDVKIMNTYSLENKQPLPLSIIEYQNSNTLIRKPEYFIKQSELVYNIDGNLIETTSKGGESSSLLYDYNNRLVIATVTNAKNNEFAYTSFEGDNLGGWIYAPSQILQNINLTPTGNKCYQLTGTSGVTSNVNINKDFILSFWAKTSAGVPIVNATLTTSNAVNEWTYYQYKINDGSPSVLINGSGIIDELRLYPYNSKMETSTYDPTKGKTSICNINNEILYNEYDGLGRLIKQRDGKRNLIKTYEYHFKN